MAKLSVELSNFVVFGGVATFGLLVWDRVINEGRILSQIENLYNEFQLSAINGDELAKVKANSAKSEADTSNIQDGEGTTREDVERPTKAEAYDNSQAGGSSLDRLIAFLDRAAQNDSNEHNQLHAHLDKLLPAVKCNCKQVFPRKNETSQQ